MDKQIFFHVGMGKTGTTFLQYNVFPKFKGISYIQRTEYRKVDKYILNATESHILISKEFDQQMERKVADFTTKHPNSTPIIVFRRHDDYIASQYRRFVKNGFRGGFDAFYNLNDSGFFKNEDLNYVGYVEMLSRYFANEPIVLIYDDLKENPQYFIEQFAKLVGASIDLNKVNLKKRHTSYSEKQLKVVAKISERVDIRKRDLSQNRFLNLFPRLYMGSIRYGSLLVGKLLPSSWVSKKPLIEPSVLNQIKAHYDKDWKAVCSMKHF